MSTQTEPHSCSKNQCKGFFDIFLNCKFCDQKINIECLLRSDKAMTSNFLYRFGMIDTKKTDEGKSYYDWQTKPNDNSIKDFKLIFGENSKMCLTCDICTNKFRASIQSEILNNAKISTSASSHNSSQTNTNQTMNQSTDMNMTQMIQGNISITDKSVVNKSPKSPVLPAKDDSGLFSVYISKSAKNVKTDELISYIMEKTDLNVDTFQIAKLSSGKRYHRTYTSFKLTALNVDVCKKIMTSEIWTNDFRVRAFDKSRLAKVKTQPAQRNKDHHDSSKFKSKNKIQSKSRNNNNMKRDSNNNCNDNRRMNAPKRTRKFNNNHQNANSNQRNRNRSGINEQQKYQNVPQQFFPAPFWYPPPQYPPPIQQQSIPVFHAQQYHPYAPLQMYQPINVQQ